MSPPTNIERRSLSSFFNENSSPIVNMRSITPISAKSYTSLTSEIKWAPWGPTITPAIRKPTIEDIFNLPRTKTIMAEIQSIRTRDFKNTSSINYYCLSIPSPFTGEGQGGGSGINVLDSTECLQYIKLHPAGQEK